MTYDAPGMQMTLTVPRSIMGRRALLPILEAATQTSERWLEDHPDVPPLYELGDRGLVRWQAEPPGQERWEPPSEVLKRRWGDCDDVAPWRAAELRVTGEDPRARADTYVSKVYPDGRRLWHAIVVRGDGTVEDPSARLGMRKRPGHYDDGSPFVPQASTMGAVPTIGHDTRGGDMSTIRWSVHRTADGYEGTIEIPWGDGGAGAAPSMLRISQRGSSPGEALEGAIYTADDVVGSAETCGIFDFGSIIPGIISSVSDVASTIARAASGRRGGGAAPALPASFPSSPVGDMSRMLAMRPGGMPYGGGFGMPMMPGMMPYGMPAGYGTAPAGYAKPPAGTGWGAAPGMMGSDGWSF